MTTALSGARIAKQIGKKFPEAVIESGADSLLLKAESLLEVADYLKKTPGLDFAYLNYITAVDYYDYFEVVYQLASIQHNHGLVLKVRCYDRQNPTLPSVVGIWRGADFQEREIYDLLGISFEGHPNLRRIVLWEGFEGYPLRKEFL
ncbi:MAG: NADH-quinone oxidoreductase subunit C [Dehalococcoidales bacterium]|nr:NADH-quinone oxidoreductase subunit C [Dehalococcoidales bacterium]